MARKKPDGIESNKPERQRVLIDLLSKGRYRTQSDIVKAFDEMGLKQKLEVSQPTIQRDLKELGIKKSDEGVYVVEPSLEQERKRDALAALLATSNAKVHYPVSFFCVKCDEGYERLLAARIRDAYAAEVVGTVTESGMVVVFTSGGEEDGAARRLTAEIGGFLG